MLETMSHRKQSWAGLGGQRRTTKTVLFCVFLMVLVALASAQQGAMSEEEALAKNSSLLMKELLTDYESGSLPSGGVKVRIQLALYQIVDVDTSKQIMQILGWWRRYWTDKRLSWDSQHWGVDALIFRVDQIWMPDDLIYEAVAETALGTQLATAYPDGSLFISVPKVSTISCPMQLKDFPFDGQHCEFVVGSMAHDGTQIDIDARLIANQEEWWVRKEEEESLAPKTAVDLQQFIVNQEFGLRMVRITTKNQYYSCCPNPYPVIEFSLGIERQVFTYVSGIIVPLVLVTFVGFAALLMPAPLSGSRPALSISVMFTTASIYFVASNKMPDIGEDTFIGRLYLVALLSNMIMTMVSIVSTSFNLVTAENKNQKSELMQMFRHFDADKSGELDREEANHALNTLGLSTTERYDILVKCGLEQKENISIDDWIRLAHVAKKYRGTTQDNVLTGKFMNFVKRIARHTDETDLPPVDHSNGEQKSNGISRGMITGSNFGRSENDALCGKAGNHEEQFSNDTGNLNGEDDDNYDVGDIEMAMEDETPQENARVRMAQLMEQFEQEQADIEKSSNGYDATDKLSTWCKMLELPDTVMVNFRREGVDIEALKNISKEELTELGVTKMGARAKLLLWASQEKPIKIGESSSFSAVVPDKLYNSPYSVVATKPQTRSPEDSNELSPTATPNRPVGIKRASSLKAASTAVAQTLKKPLKKATKRFAHHLGATLDFWSFCVWPTAFILYLIIEFSNVSPKSGNAYSSPATTQIVLVDNRTDDGYHVCYRNYQSTSAAALRYCTGGDTGPDYT